MSIIGKDLTSVVDLDHEDAMQLLEIALDCKKNKAKYATALVGKTMVLIFEKPSLRTRVTFETGIYQMGGHPIYLSPADVGLGTRETVPDVARNLSRWVDVIVARTFEHAKVEGLSKYASISVVNALSDDEHPCQALADLLTVYERWADIKKQRIAYIGDGNNVCNSLLLLCGLTGTPLSIGTPEGYAPCEHVVEKAREYYATSGGDFLVTTDPAEAVKGCSAVYTDVWASMGEEAQAEEKNRIFAPYQINSELMKKAEPDALFMHCLPAHRGQEVTDEVIDSPNSVVFDQAENRLHAQKAVLYRLLAG